MGQLLTIFFNVVTLVYMRFNLYQVFLWLICTAFIVVTPPVYAQTLDLRTSLKSDYTRLVFDWDQNVSYTVSKISSDKIKVIFQKRPEALPDFSVFTRSEGIKSVVLKGGETQTLTLEIELSKSADIRDFTIGSRILIDVYIKNKVTQAPPKEPIRQTPPAKIVKKKAPEFKEKENAKVKEEVKSIQDVAPKLADQSVTPPSEDKFAEVRPKLAKLENVEVDDLRPKIELVEEHLISISSTNNFNLAAFKRLGYLWIVTDQDNRATTPQIRGKQSHLMKPIKVLRGSGGTAYLIPLNRFNHLNVEAEGGGLLWRFILTDTLSNQQEGAQIQRQRTSLYQDNILFSNLKDIGSVLTFTDPTLGDDIHVVTVSRSNSFLKTSQAYVDVDIIPAFVGAAVIEKSDGVNVSTVGLNGFEVTKTNGGLNFLNEQDFELGTTQEDVETIVETSQDKLYFFSRWYGGGLSDLEKNRQDLERKIIYNEDEFATEDIIQLAKLFIANKFSQEALGYLDLAVKQNPNLLTSNSFLLLRGVSNALAGRGFEALRDLDINEFADQAELRLWQAYSYSIVEDWANAYEYAPRKGSIILDYPKQIRHKVALALGEASLRYGDQELAISFLEQIRKDRDTASKSDQAALKYLEGELRRQEGSSDDAARIWKELTEGEDRLHRAKAALSLVKIELKDSKITGNYALDVLDRIRYTWRGDGLETQINYTLGLLLIQKKDFKKGLDVLKETATLAFEEKDRNAIAVRMQDIFVDVLAGERKDDVNSIEAISIFENFSELLPAGEKGDKVIAALVERLIDVDLLARAQGVLEKQIKHRLKGESKLNAQMQLARVYLLDRKPALALDTLNEIDVAKLVAQNAGSKLEIDILKARSLSDLDRPEQALRAIQRLPENDRVLALKANIAWQKSDWEKASLALQKRLDLRDIDTSAEPDENDTQLILNLAISYKLSGNQDKLIDLKSRFEDYMSQSTQSKLFQVVSRKPEDVGINDRDEILSFVAEVDLFKDVLTDF